VVATAVVVGLLLALLIFELSRLVPELGKGGQDYALYIAGTERWLAGGGFYSDAQLAGPYPIVKSEVLYPPPTLLLFIPFTVLPAFLWWAIPLGTIGLIVLSWRPTQIGWTGLLGLLVLPTTGGWSWTLDVIYNGNPAMWSAAFVALATRFPFFGPFALLKFTLAHSPWSESDSGDGGLGLRSWRRWGWPSPRCGATTSSFCRTLGRRARRSSTQFHRQRLR
jgi:hypothetical protein